MIGTRVWQFPLVVIALSSRRVGFAAAAGPMRLDAVRSWSVQHVSASRRMPLLKLRVLRAVERFEPRTILVTHGARWGLGRRVRARVRNLARTLGLRIELVDLGDACRIVGVNRLQAAAERIVDSYPERARFVRAFLGPTAIASNARDRRPTLSAMTVAHAASVAHLIKFG